MKPTIPSIALLAAVALLGPEAAAGPARGAQDTAGFVGSKVCAECHDETVASFAVSRHAKTWAASSGYATAGCESCHGPGGEHQKSQTRATIVAFTRGTSRPAEELSGRCLGCHAAGETAALWDSGAHRKNDVACTRCHRIHGAASARPTQPEVCFGCHRSVKFDVAKRSHHPILEGKVDCSSCHDPHGTLTPRLLKAESVNELCFGCHAEKRGPFVWEHFPVEENCTICHAPHGSRQAKLLVKKVPNLCQECHDFSRHPGTAYDARTGFRGAAPSNRSFGRSCMNCHSSIHGSWAPANPDNGENAGDVWMR